MYCMLIPPEYMISVKGLPDLYSNYTYAPAKLDMMCLMNGAIEIISFHKAEGTTDIGSRPGVPAVNTFSIAIQIYPATTGASPRRCVHKESARDRPVKNEPAEGGTLHNNFCEVRRQRKRRWGFVRGRCRR